MNLQQSFENWMMDNQVAFLQACHHVRIDSRNKLVIRARYFNGVGSAIDISSAVSLDTVMDGASKLLC